jgi:hypothetical protein
VISSAVPRSRSNLPLSDTSTEGSSAGTYELTLGEQLELIRHDHRVRRLQQALAALHARVGDYEEASVPTGLRSAIAGFERDLAVARRRLGILDKPVSPRGWDNVIYQ